MTEWQVTTDDAYCGSRKCRRIVVRRGDEYITVIGPRPYAMRELRERTGQRHFGDHRPFRASSDRFWKQMWDQPDIETLWWKT